MELIVVIIIVGVIAAVALPNFAFVIEQMKAKEAEGILKVLLQAQNDYYLENGYYSDTIDDLGVEIPGSNDFDNYTIVAECDDSGTPCAYVDRSNGLYTVYILRDGSLACQNYSAENICNRLNYSEIEY